LEHNAYVLIAEYHAPEGDAGGLHSQLLKFFTDDKILRQKDTFNPELFFNLLAVTPSGLLHHMPQYKEKEKTALMFTYPVLMAHDIAGYDRVIVGDDQKPHIEFAKDILYRVGCKCPQPIYPEHAARVMDLRDPTRKMSKSKPETCLFLDDDMDTIASKIKKAVTDEVGRKNLENIYLALDFQEPIPELSIDLKDAIIYELQRVLK